VSSGLSANYIHAARIIFILFGSIGALWGIIDLPVSWRVSSTEHIAERIIAGDQYRTEFIARQISSAKKVGTLGYCRPIEVRSAAIIELRSVEMTVSPSDNSGERLNALSELVTNALFCEPADSFMWLALYRVENAKNRFSQVSLQYLRMSYLLGPNEGWIALRRNRIAFAAFNQLPSDIAKEAINEFIGLVKTGLYGVAADILTGPAWSARDVILPHLMQVNERDRKAFADALYQRGYDVNVPGVDSSSHDIR
jgi:hypothetical protein